MSNSELNHQGENKRIKGILNKLLKTNWKFLVIQYYEIYHQNFLLYLANYKLKTGRYYRTKTLAEFLFCILEYIYKQNQQVNLEYYEKNELLHLLNTSVTHKIRKLEVLYSSNVLHKIVLPTRQHIILQSLNKLFQTRSKQVDKAYIPQEWKSMTAMLKVTDELKIELTGRKWEAEALMIIAFCYYRTDLPLPKIPTLTKILFRDGSIARGIAQKIYRMRRKHLELDKFIQRLKLTEYSVADTIQIWENITDHLQLTSQELIP